jgi:hypothetical protein
MDQEDKQNPSLPWEDNVTDNINPLFKGGDRFSDSKRGGDRVSKSDRVSNLNPVYHSKSHEESSPIPSSFRGMNTNAFTRNKDMGNHSDPEMAMQSKSNYYNSNANNNEAIKEPSSPHYYAGDNNDDAYHDRHIAASAPIRRFGASTSGRSIVTTSGRGAEWSQNALSASASGRGTTSGRGAEWSQNNRDAQSRDAQNGQSRDAQNVQSRDAQNGQSRDAQNGQSRGTTSGRGGLTREISFSRDAQSGSYSRDADGQAPQQRSSFKNNVSRSSYEQSY